ncbi:hypothetical protein AYL99_11047 [Fonsecaea erecta]|uniref:Alpha/beta hydrolase fold-3 domain-containing protein n=1 Tax=Fonsecaea erecta TaxID=1367422 RepID=A0A178Z4D2_9EURO|nr:hypothetical protein AYL99_11047 [Fonsecaea erecta]OAP54599.1 hypothetical protein AYL99_11047 [Fonsecaea erecta]
MEGPRSENLRYCILNILLTWIFSHDNLNVFDFSHRPSFEAITAGDISRIDSFLNKHFAGRQLHLADVWQQTFLLSQILANPESENGGSKGWTRRFNWLMNAAIVFLGAVSGTPNRDFLQPRALPMEAMSKWISRRFNVPFTVQDLEYHITHWVIILSSCAGEAQHTLLPCTPRVDWTMAKYLRVPLSPLSPKISEHLCGEYKSFHEEVVQWYPPRVWGNRITPMSPYEAKTDIFFHFEANIIDHYISHELRVRQLPYCGSGAYRRGQFPLPHDDAMLIANWVRGRVGKRDVILAGVSSGGNLAAATALAWSAKGCPPVGLLLVAPSLDNTFECEERWKEYWDAPWLTPETMRFFQSRCFTGPGDRSRDNWRASPIYADQKTLESMRSFPTKIVAMTGDILFRESLDFASRLEEAGCPTTLSAFPYGHTGLLMQGIMGPALLEDLMEWINQRARSVQDPGTK